MPAKEKELTYYEWCMGFKKWIDGHRKAKAMLRYHFKMNPDTLSIQEFAFRLVELEWIKEEEAKASRT